VKLVQSVAPGLPFALADRDRLAQVLLNLVRNAITYTPAGGIVSIGVSQADLGHLAIVVADTGIGIPPDELDRVFDRFYRADTSRARASGGFGLGLAIVRDLVQAMGGTVSATSAPGEGSQFRVVLRTA
jgi:signal transduction histidine kinase